MRHLPILFILFLLVACMAGCRPVERQEKSPGKDLLIATSSNMQYAMEPLLKVFEQKTGYSCRQVIGSSGKLTAQVISGAPFDILLSADMAYPETLHNKGYSLDTPRIYAYGRLVLWSLVLNQLDFPASLLQDSLHHIALANPDTAPYGKAAREALRGLGKWNELETKMVYGESISQVNQFVLSGVAEVGFTAESVVRSPRLQDTGTWVPVPEELHQPIAQGLVLLNTGDAPAEAQQAFAEFLHSEDARKILGKFGYSTFARSLKNTAP